MTAPSDTGHRRNEVRGPCSIYPKWTGRGAITANLYNIPQQVPLAVETKPVRSTLPRDKSWNIFRGAGWMSWRSPSTRTTIAKHPFHFQERVLHLGPNRCLVPLRQRFRTLRLEFPAFPRTHRHRHSTPRTTISRRCSQRNQPSGRGRGDYATSRITPVRVMNLVTRNRWSGWWRPSSRLCSPAPLPCAGDS